MLFAAIPLALAGIAAAVIGWLSITDRLPRQRSDAPTISDEAWSAAHRAGGPWVIGSGISMFVGGTMVAAAGLEQRDAAIVLAVSLATAAATAAIASTRARRAAEAVAST